MKRGWLGVIVLAVVAHAPVHAGAVIHLEVKQLTEDPPSVELSDVTIEGRNFKVDAEISGEGGPKHSMIYRGDDGMMIAIDHAKREYMKIDREQMKGMAGQMGQAMKQMEEQLANLPPEQQKMAREMMAKRMPQMMPGAAEPEPAIEIRATSERGTFGEYAWRKYEAYRGDEKVREYKVAEWSTLDVGPEIFEAFKEMGKFVESLQESLGGAVPVDNPFGEVEKLGGFPVVTVEFEDGAPVSESVLKLIEKKESLGPATFQPPAGYRPSQMMMPGDG